jgi:hypothetical protein
MKKIINIKLSVLLLLLVTLCAGICFQSCQKNDDEQKMPVISYIRVCDPVKSDSLVAHAYMGNNIVIIGQNLKDVTQIWFNDQAASLNPNLVTDNDIIVPVPTVIPSTVTNTMLLINRNKIDTCKYEFGVDVPAPEIDNMTCEYVADDGTAIINGDYFVDDPSSPLTVYFPGNIPGTVTSIAINKVKVTVPSGVNPGQITVKTLYGSTISSFWFRDNRNIVVNFDDLTAAGGWRSGKIASSNPDPIDGNFVRFSGTMAGTAGSTWDEDNFSFDFWPIANGRDDVPLYSGDLSSAVIKFECNVLSAWKASALQMIFTPYSTNGTNSYIADSSVPRGLWIPWKTDGTYQTDGWITVSIPLSEFTYTPDGLTCVNKLTSDMLGGLTFFVYNGGVKGTDCTPNICIDNIRIVPGE